jgi:hypothetical protein
MEGIVAKTKPVDADNFAGEMADAIVAIVEKHGLLTGGGVIKISDGVYTINYTTQPGGLSRGRPRKRVSDKKPRTRAFKGSNRSSA